MATKRTNDFKGFNEFTELSKILLVVLIVFFGVYFITDNFIKSNDKKDDNTDTTTNIQYERILAGETFNQSDKDYYVIYYDFKANDYNLINYKIGLYNKKETKLPLYQVDLSNSFNSNVISDESNKNAQTSTNLKIKGLTLIKISNGKNIEYIDNYDKIMEILK